ncbi:DinB family protein [Daejeonella sp. JGW-45]|uniref:DinB family protein n=1 Tax=Daejeonella sp. JGW-45 TaxID=3034148 RepID=UPI0023EC39C1|nr:DinB family protein [Daejeonella sp. JGW-45]
MIKQLDIIRKTRTAILNLISDMTIEELNKIPAGFNNNIIWNVAHLVAAQDNIFYVKAGLPLKNISQQYFDSYKPGSKPERALSGKEFEEIKSLLFSSVDKLEEDIELKIFGDYTPWKTRYGFDMESINDGLTLLPFHDGLHFGYVMALKRVLRSEA